MIPGNWNDWAKLVLQAVIGWALMVSLVWLIVLALVYLVNHT